MNRGDYGLDAAKIQQFKSGLLAWFADKRRDFYWRSAGACTYTKVVSEVLLQRTQAPVVSNFLPTFISAFPSWNAIAESDEEDVGEILRPLGLWRRRAKALVALAGDLSRREGCWPADRHELETMPAVGQYVASAVLMFEHGVAAPLMDASMARVLRRYFEVKPEKADIRYDKPLQALANAVVDDPDAVKLNWAILDFAALQCKKAKPECETCPLRKGCVYFARTRELG